MTLCRGDKFDAAVQMLIVVPVDKPFGPIPRCGNVRKRLGRIVRLIFQGSKGGLRIGVVIAYRRPAEGRVRWSCLFGQFGSEVKVYPVIIYAARFCFTGAGEFPIRCAFE